MIFGLIEILRTVVSGVSVCFYEPKCALAKEVSRYVFIEDLDGLES